MREDTLILVRRLISFYLAVGENFSQHINVMLFGMDSRNRWQGNQRQVQTLSMEQNGTSNNQPVNHNSYQQTNRIP